MMTMESIQSHVLRRLRREAHTSARLFLQRTWDIARGNFEILRENRRMSPTVDLEFWRGPVISHTKGSRRASQAANCNWLNLSNYFSDNLIIPDSILPMVYIKATSQGNSRSAHLLSPCLVQR
ncbi:hypothetical protein Y032_0307g2023 [Ancylostoma ceylanicum]|uniref:Uncharacterized protein n=1 Tax=Ancylostoma ceylanicum TaxID=53326 RepID=A0A016S3L5_9BILA|nr:hypothetical protein Y032_0307g2023 [Ancylostoma ceylanicum]